MDINAGRRDELLDVATASMPAGTGRARALLLIDLNGDEPHELGGHLERRGFQVMEVGSTARLHDDEEPLAEIFEAVVLTARLPDAEALAAIRQLNRACSCFSSFESHCDAENTPPAAPNGLWVDFIVAPS
jgi:hypothetical protein